MYDTSSWQQLRHFRAATSDAAELSWSPDGGRIALVDGPLRYKVAVHAADGRCEGVRSHMCDHEPCCASGNKAQCQSIRAMVALFSAWRGRMGADGSHSSRLDMAPCPVDFVPLMSL